MFLWVGHFEDDSEMFVEYLEFSKLMMDESDVRFYNIESKNVELKE